MMIKPKQNKRPSPRPCFATPIVLRSALSSSFVSTNVCQPNSFLSQYQRRRRLNKPSLSFYSSSSCCADNPPQSSSSTPPEDSEPDELLQPISSQYGQDESLSPSSPRPPAPRKNDISVSTAVSSAPTLNEALAEATSRSLANLSSGGPPNLAIVHISVRYSIRNAVGSSGRHSIDLVVPRLRGLIPSLTTVVGCTVDGVIGSNSIDETVEIEHAPAISLTLLRLPRINITPFHIMPDDLPSPDALQTEWHKIIFGNKEKQKQQLQKQNSNTSFLVFSDPTFASRGELDKFLSGIEYAFPDSCVAGSLASAAATFVNGHMICTLPRDILRIEGATGLRDSGVVGIALSGDIELDCLLSHGCRSIGPEFEVRRIDSTYSSTSSNTNVMELEIINRPSTCLPTLSHLKSIISYATPTEKELLSDKLYIGILLDNDQVIIKNILNIDNVNGSITINSKDIRIGQRVRFHILENETIEKNLKSTSQKYKRIELANSLVGYSNPPFGALMFADIARSQGTFKEPNMEIKNLTSVAKGISIGGAFSAGQIAPPSNSPDEKENDNKASVLQTATNLVVFMRRRSGMTSSASSLPDFDGSDKQSSKDQ